MASYMGPSVVTWEDFKYRYVRSYPPEEDQERLAIFKDKCQLVNEHNQNPQFTFKLATNKFSDWTTEELNSLRTAANPVIRSAPWENDYYSDSAYNLPTFIDWRTSGFVTPVKDQGQRGSSWAFSATGSLEGQLKRRTGKLVSLSEQQLMGNAGTNGDCRDGTVELAFNSVKDEGICSESSYSHGASTLTKLTGYRKIKGERALMQAVAKDGPVSVAVHASRFFQNYSTGIFVDFTCSPDSKDMNHAVLVVGYGTELGNGSKLDYWIVKNSWGTDWGEGGYIRMARNQGNQCGIEIEGCLPVLPWFWPCNLM